jgi:serpin B
MLATAPLDGDSVVGGDGNASSQLRLAREVGLRAAAGRGSNFIVSPLSIHAALALVAAGARGETLQELLGFLGSASLDGLHGAAWSGLARGKAQRPDADVLRLRRA